MEGTFCSSQGSCFLLSFFSFLLFHPFPCLSSFFFPLSVLPSSLFRTILTGGGEATGCIVVFSVCLFHSEQSSCECNAKPNKQRHVRVFRTVPRLFFTKSSSFASACCDAS
jgi:hypothetical protein